MKKDRLETENLAVKPQYKDILKLHRNFLEAFAKKHKDETTLAMLRQI
jgi:hypothetical protein